MLALMVMSQLADVVKLARRDSRREADGKNIFNVVIKQLNLQNS